MRKIFILLLLNIFAVSCASSKPLGTNPALEIKNKYQAPDPNVNVVNPYVVNLMATDLLIKESNMEEVKNYITWYLSHLNYPDKFGLTGSIYDYKIYSDAKVKSLRTWGSVDSYAATFLMLIYKYYKATGDKEMIEANRQKLEDIAYLIPHLQDEDGLTMASPQSSAKYLMNNCESYGGLNAFIELSEEFGWGLESFYEPVKGELKDAILTKFYEGAGKTFYFSIDGENEHFSNLNILYPKAYAQLFPILYDILPEGEGIKEGLWKQFHEYYQDRPSEIPVIQQIIHDWVYTKLSQKNPAIEIMSKYQILEWGTKTVVPYLVNLMAIDLLRTESDVEEVKNYITWYLSHLNNPDEFGLTGSIYDYEIDFYGKERSLDRWDSVDSYAATFILLIYEYYKVTGDRSLIEANQQKLKDVAFLIPYLRREDGLTLPFPQTTVKYLMNNCECYGGLNAFTELSREFNWDLEYVYGSIKEDLKDAILTHFYDEAGEIFCWAIDKRDKHTSNWGIFYPDAYAQLFPILFNILSEEEAIKENLWHQFHEYHQDRLSDMPIEQRIVYDWTSEVMK